MELKDRNGNTYIPEYYTPRNEEGTFRYKFKLSEEDWKTVIENAWCDITDQKTGKRYRIETEADCGMSKGCQCDAIAEPFDNEERK